jgi:PAS domain S-box-containing protein
VVARTALGGSPVDEERGETLYYRAVLDAAPAALLIVRSDGGILRVNGEAQRLFGYDEAELLGQSIEVLVPERLRAGLLARRSAYVAAPHPGPRGTLSTTLGRRKGGTEFPAEIVLSPLRVEGSFLVCVGVRDETARKRLQTQLGASERMASLGVLAAGVGHEISNPLTIAAFSIDFAIQSLHRLRTEFGDRPGLRELEAILADGGEASARIQAIVEDLRLSARVDIDLKPRTALDISKVRSSALRMVKMRVGFRTRVICSCEALSLVQGDETHLGQVFLNLLINAAQAIPKGGTNDHEIRVTARVESADRVVGS